MTAIYTVETHWDKDARSKMDAYGIPQLMVDTAQAVVDSWGHSFKVSPEDLKRCPGLAIHISCAHFRHLLKTFDGDYIRATRAYGAGEGAVTRSKKLPGIRYFENVLKQYERLRMN